MNDLNQNDSEIGFQKENDINRINITGNNSPNIRNNEKLVDFSNNSSVIYESFESNDSKDSDKSFNTSDDKILNQFCGIDCEVKSKRLSDENERLKTQINQLEEQIVDILKDKQSLDSELNSIKECFDRKMNSKIQEIEHLTNTLLVFESLNSSLEIDLSDKIEEKVKLELYVKEMEDKLSYSEKQLSELQESESDLLISYNNTKQAFNEEESNKYKTIQQLHKVYVECAAQQNLITELNEQNAKLIREIDDKENELWFYKSKTEDSCPHCSTIVKRDSDKSFKDSIIINKTTEIPDYSFSVNDDDFDHIYQDFNEDIVTKQLDDSYSSIEESVQQQDKHILIKLFLYFISFLNYFMVKLPFRLILAIVLIVITTKVLLVSVFHTNLPPYTSWEEILYRIIFPYLTKVKVSKTQ